MTFRTRTCLLPICTLAAVLSLGAEGRQAAPRTRPELVLTANPLVAFAPARVKFTVGLLAGRDDYEEFYCASIEWDWDDGTVSQWTRDCQPYKAGRSKIQRRFAAVHTFDAPDNYEVTFRLKKRGKVVAQTRTNVEVRSGSPEEK
jgi:hypothetical protein